MGLGDNDYAYKSSLRPNGGCGSLVWMKMVRAQEYTKSEAKEKRMMRMSFLRWSCVRARAKRKNGGHVCSEGRRERLGNDIDWYQAGDFHEGRPGFSNELSHEWSQKISKPPPLLKQEETQVVTALPFVMRLMYRNFSSLRASLQKNAQTSVEWLTADIAKWVGWVSNQRCSQNDVAFII